MSEYPEHDKLDAIKEQSQAIGEFLDFSPYVLCRVVPEGDNGKPRWLDRSGEPTNDREACKAVPPSNPAYEAWNEHFRPVYVSIPTLLAEWFEIDQDELEREKRAMLDKLRGVAV